MVVMRCVWSSDKESSCFILEATASAFFCEVAIFKESCEKTDVKQQTIRPRARVLREYEIMANGFNKFNEWQGMLQ